MVLGFFKRKKKPVLLTNSLGMDLSRIEPGSFTMGSTPDEVERVSGETAHYVNLTKPYLLGTALVTQRQWKKLMGNNPAKHKGDDDLPVDRVSWEEAIEFCRKLSIKDKREYRLPTEAEWEFACRAGTETPFWFGAVINPEDANYDSGWSYNGGKKSKRIGKTTKAETYPANPHGLYDMHGNLWEWCNDWHARYDSDKNTDPKGALRSEHKVLRGGSWMHTPRRARSASRGQEEPTAKEPFIGFRVATSDVD